MGMKAEVLNTKTKPKLGFWNVRTMNETGKLAQFPAEMRHYSLYILGVRESRWTGSRRLTAAPGETLLFSGWDDGQHHEGVAILLKKGVERSLLERKSISSRLMRARLKGKHNTITLIQCYAPTNDSDKEVKRGPCHNLIIVMGDLNAKVGKDNTNNDRAMGRHGCGTMNENGERLVDVCNMNDLVIGGTLFQHCEIHRLTWCSPNGRDKNQIDHIMINGKCGCSLTDVKVGRGADVGSDHHLVTASIKLKLGSVGPPNKGHRHYDIDKLKSLEIQKGFVLQLKNRFQALADLDEEEGHADVEINKKRDKVTGIYKQSSDACLGYRRKRWKEWITPSTWNAIETRRALKKKVLYTKSQKLKDKYRKQYNQAHQEVKRLVRKDKQHFINNLATYTEDAAVCGEQGTSYKMTQLISGKWQTPTHTVIRSKQGHLLTTGKEQEMCWTEHFKELLNREPSEEEANIQEAEEDLDINTDTPTKEETIQAINSLKNGKAPGKDNSNAELFKVNPKLAASILAPLFTSVWEREKVPDEWTNGVIVKISKKGTLSDCNNWRGITLLSVPSKVLCKFIVQRILEGVNSVLRKEQAGFWKGHGCTDQIFTLRNIIEQSLAWQWQLYKNFIDFEKAFDSIHRTSLWRVLWVYGIPFRIINVIKSFYFNYTCSVDRSELSFEVKTGVRQRCVMSAILFNTAIDWVMQRTTEDMPRGIKWTPFSSLEDLDFTDDVALLSQTKHHIQEKTTRLNAFSQQIGLKIGIIQIS
ncbi:uncharacterized protein LOC135983272 [Chrysemys picta bellii]|uniref:uncharacterized protein LOC135983272 n=1 Tax=Chrysemys picta bellii TaxID=8478 RepID=UPI0032B1E9C9